MQRVIRLCLGTLDFLVKKLQTGVITVRLHLIIVTGVPDLVYSKFGDSSVLCRMAETIGTV